MYNSNNIPISWLYVLCCILMAFKDIFAQCPDSQVLSNLKRLHEHISPANENYFIPDQYYCTPDDFNNFLKENFSKIEQVSNFTCYHFNCRSLP